jgi:two-component system OmpR family response regulator
VTTTSRPGDLQAAPGLQGPAPELSILIIQKDAETGWATARNLDRLGLASVVAPDVAHGVSAARAGRHGLVLLDLELADQDTFGVLAEIRAAQPRLPVVVMTTLDDVDHRVRALDAGAVDCVLSTLCFDEVAARMRAHLRQADISRSPHLSGAGIDVDLVSRTALHRGTPIQLTPMEFRLLVHLMQRPGVTQSRREILRDVWGQTDESGRNLVDVYVGYLRRKLGVRGRGCESPIQTVRSRGYRFADGQGDGLARDRREDSDGAAPPTRHGDGGHEGSRRLYE